MNENNDVLVLAKSSGRRKKLQKKALKGEITSIENYNECISLNIFGSPEITVTNDPTRKISKHDLNLNEIRDLLLSIFLNKHQPRYFTIKNKPFIRNILLIHISDCINPSLAISEINNGEPIFDVKITKNATDIASFPNKLLTLSLSDIEELKYTEELRGNTSSSDSKKQIYGTIDEYILSDSALWTWGYPKLYIASSSTSNEISTIIVGNEIENDENLNKKIVNEIEQNDTKIIEIIEEINNRNIGDNGLVVGTLPSIDDSNIIISKLTTFNVQFSQNLFDKDYLTTLSNKEIENKLWLENNNFVQPQSIVAVDCEMCGIEGNKSILTRLTIVDQYSKVLLDIYVKPEIDTPIIDYRTEWSGISKKTLENVTITQNQARLAFLRLVSSETILIGHSLENDLKSLKILHRKCIDTSIIYPHSKGYPLRLKLKKLAETHLSLKIQSGGAKGHDSVEDARAAMQLVNLKVERGPLFGIKSPQQVREALLGLIQPELLSSSIFVTSSSDVYSSIRQCISNTSNSEKCDDTFTAYNKFEEYISNNLLISSINSTTSSSSFTFGYLGIKQSSTNSNDLNSYILKIKELLKKKSENKNTLLIITSQTSLSDVIELNKKRKRATENLMSTNIWTNENENDIREKNMRANIGHISLNII